MLREWVQNPAAIEAPPGNLHRPYPWRQIIKDWRDQANLLRIPFQYRLSSRLPETDAARAASKGPPKFLTPPGRWPKYAGKPTCQSATVAWEMAKKKDERHCNNKYTVCG